MNNLSIAYLLVFHGSRYATAAIAASRLANLLTERLPNPLVSTAALELADLSLDESIIDFAQVAIADDYQTIQIVPLFLSQGVHVREDIPAAMALAQKKLGTTINLELTSSLGNCPEMPELLTQQLKSLSSSRTKRILLAHGSRLAGGNLPYEHLAKQLNAVNAYWSVPPDLAKIVKSLVRKENNTIEIILYFLFPGKITEAIAEQVQQLQAQFPQIDLILTPPLAATPGIIEHLALTIDH
ncbi:MAG: sirohydrochlorin chelatase [Cyanobacteria bacterium P01_F01_bin.143]